MAKEGGSACKQYVNMAKRADHQSSGFVSIFADTWRNDELLKWTSVHIRSTERGLRTPPT